MTQFLKYFRFLVLPLPSSSFCLVLLKLPVIVGSDTYFLSTRCRMLESIFGDESMTIIPSLHQQNYDKEWILLEVTSLRMNL